MAPTTRRTVQKQRPAESNSKNEILIEAEYMMYWAK